MAIGQHHTTAKTETEWLTPPWILEELGPFDTDPCSPSQSPWKTARTMYSCFDNGLNMPWFGRVWLNPPYDHNKMWNWFDKLYRHGNGIALIFARTETEGFFRWIWNRADSILFIKGRLYFYHLDGTKAKANSGGPSVLIAYGKNNSEILARSNIQGKYLNL